MVSLGSINHDIENNKLIHLLKVVEKEIKNYKIIFRPHPAMKRDLLQKKIKAINIKNQYEIEESKNIFDFSYDLNSICICGMSGIYYDFLYLGYKTLNFDFGYEVKKRLPRVIEPFINENQFIEQLELCKNIDHERWYQMTRPILKDTLGLDVLEERKTALIDDIDNCLSQVSLDL